jgi:hypothetical protein
MNSGHFLSSIKSKVEESMWLGKLKEKGLGVILHKFFDACTLNPRHKLPMKKGVYICIWISFRPKNCFLDKCRYDPSDGWMDPTIGGKAIPPNNNTC